MQKKTRTVKPHSSLPLIRLGSGVYFGNYPSLAWLGKILTNVNGEGDMKTGKRKKGKL
jgi:hypothetical protein